ncbi:protein of unknown function [Magnetospira sp. QH-2]|nr:protein of unknown function [Magnetospira sp. QH-2]
MAAAPAFSQSSRYQSWQDPAAVTAPDTTVQDLVSQLRKLVDEAEKARAADPQFLRDLRALADGHDRPWSATQIDDSFADGDYTRGPAWTVTSGRYWIESGYGLRSSVLALAQTDQPQQKKMSNEQKAFALLGAVLGTKTQTQQAATATAAPASAAAIHLDSAISNAFSIRVELAAWKPDGRIEFGPGQSASGDGGYRLAYGNGGRWELLRVGSRGSSVVDVTPTPQSIEDNKVHVVEWTRGRDGVMTVTLDHKPLMKATDMGYRDAFDRLLITNHAGDFTFKRVTVQGAP